jgi:hypothetical protein
MPYKIEKRGDKYVVVNEETGDVKGTHDTKEKAVAQMRLLYGIEHGWEPSKNKKKPKTVVPKESI